MADSATEKPRLLETQEFSKQTEFQVGRTGHQVAAGASAPPLDGAAVARIRRSPQHALRSDMLALQRTVGNRAVAALVRGEARDVAIQAKLEVGPVNDVYERQADHIARLVTSGMTQRKAVVNTKPKDEEGQEASSQSGPNFNIKRMVQRKYAESSGVRADGSFAANADVQARIRRMEGGGRPLPETIRREMEPRFGADLGGVRIHTGGEAVQLSREIGARAFTHGTHIAFGAGGYSPNSQAGRHLLAHELTHTIQQTGVRPLTPVQRSPKGTIQRGVWESVKNFFSRKKPEPVVAKISGPVTGNAKQIQEAALQKASEALATAQTLFNSAKEKADQKLRTESRVTPDMEEAGKEGVARLDVAKKAISRMKKGDDVLKGFITKYKQDLEEIRAKIEANRGLIALNGEKVGDNGSAAHTTAMQSHMLADESAQLVEKLREQSGSLNSGDTDVAQKRAGMKGRTLGYDARSMGAAEKSASDSVLDLAEIKAKVQGYFLYLDTDRKVLQEHTARKAASISSTYGSTAAFRAMGSAMTRANAPTDPGVLTTEQAFDVAGGPGAMEPPEDEEEAPPSEGISLVTSMQMLAGKKQGEKAMRQAQTLNQGSQGQKPEQSAKLSKSEQKFARRVKRLEMRHMLYIKAERRMPIAKEYLEKTEKLYTDANALYETVDALRAGENHTPEKIDQATRAAGDARVKVAEAAVYMAKMRKFKEEVYNESQQYEKYVGPRAMSKTKRRVKKLGGMVMGAGMRALTAGMYRIEAEDEAGGYRVGFKSRTIIDDIIKKHYELKLVLRGVNSKPVRGLGGKHGARAYVFFKALSFALQIIRDIASAVALWVTIVTVGAGAPVGAAFASLALFSAMAKGAIDLLLLIWSAIGLANTNDPTSRMILRGENTRQGLAFGEGVFAGASAGMVMGFSGQTGLLNFGKQDMAFGAGSQVKDLSGTIEGQIANVAVGPATPALGNIGQNVGVNALSPYIRHANIETRKHDEMLDKVRNAKKAIRVVSNPAREAFLKLSDFAQKQKKMRESKFVAILPEISKTIEEMGSTAQQVPESAPPEQRSQ